MSLLFPALSPLPDGFGYWEEFLDEQGEAELLAITTAIELHTFTFRGYEAKRKVMSFGYDYNFDQRTIKPGVSVPAAFGPLIKKVAGHLSMAPADFVEVLVTEYPEGSVINWHRDAPPFDIIVGVSLLSDCVFRLRPYDKAAQKRSAIISIPLKRRSLYVMRGSARTDWEHSIPPMKQPRYSITLRTLRGGRAENTITIA